MGEDEEATVRTITAYREVMTTLIHQHRGKVVDSPGDNLLAEFASVVDAVQCAVAVQKEISARNTELPENRQMQFRIGINLGDVIQEGDRIYGDGVNIAARLECLANPGGICISKTAFDHIESKVPYGYEFIGDQNLKNIAKPVGAFHVLMEPRVTITEEKNKSLPLPEELSIAVLPFTNISGDPEQEYFSDGLSEEIITALSKVDKMFVIARNSTFAYKGKPANVQQIGKELGVRYVLEGSVRKAGGRVRITAQLVDASTGRHLWSDRYDRDLKDIFVLQDEITMKILTALRVKLTEGEQARTASKGTNNLKAYLKFLQSFETIRRFNRESNALAKQLAEEAVALDPKYAPAYRALSLAHQMDVWLGTSKSPKQSRAKAMELAQKAIALDDTYAEAYGDLGFLLSMKQQHDKAVATAEHGVALNPNSADAHMLLGHTLRFSGRYEESILEFKIAIRLNPIPPNNYLFGIANSYAKMGQYEEAITWGKKAVRQKPNSFLAHIILTEIYCLSGREEEARAQAAEVLRIQPKFSLEKWAKRVKGPDKEKVIDALRKAGLK
jgi:adenylate cyclase